MAIDKEHETTGNMNYAERNAFQNKKLAAEATSSKQKQNEYDAEYEDDNEDNDEYDASDYKNVDPDVEGGKITFIKLTPEEKAADKSRVRSLSSDLTDDIFEGYDCDKAMQKAISASVAASTISTLPPLSCSVDPAARSVVPAVEFVNQFFCFHSAHLVAA